MKFLERFFFEGFWIFFWKILEVLMCFQRFTRFFIFSNSQKFCDQVFLCIPSCGVFHDQCFRKSLNPCSEFSVECFVEIYSDFLSPCIIINFPPLDILPLLNSLYSQLTTKNLPNFPSLILNCSVKIPDNIYTHFIAI